MSFQQSLAWRKISKFLVEERQDLVESLIQKNDDITRGKIQIIDELLDRFSSETEEE